MKVLLFGNSATEPRDGIRKDQLMTTVSVEKFARETGQRYDLVVRKAWPNDRLPALAAAWMAEEKPNLVLMSVNDYWYNYESVPRKLKERYGRVGKWVGDLGDKAAKNPRIAHNGVFKSGRKVAERAIGGEAAFTPEQVIEVMQDCIRIVLRSEQATVVFVGPMGGRDDDYPEAVKERRRARRNQVHAAMKAFCASVHVDYMGMDSETAARLASTPRSTSGDGLHPDAAGHQRSGEFWLSVFRPWVEREIEKEAEAEAAAAEHARG